MAETRPSRFNAWYRAARPRTLTATYVPLGVAAALAIQNGVFDLLRFVLSLIAALLLQVAANLINEYFDYRRGAEELKQAGQGMVLKRGVMTPREVLIGAVVTVVAGSLIGLFLLTQSGPLLLWIGLAGVLVVVSYTAGPFPLAYKGLGEIAVFIFMGPLMVLGAYYVMARQFSAAPLVVGIPIGFMVAAIMLANNIRDLDADRAVKKNTLAVRLGDTGARQIYFVLVVSAYMTVGAFVVSELMPITTLAVLLTVPEARRLVYIFGTSRNQQTLHQAMGRTARLHGVFGLWMVIGWGAWLAFQLIQR
ncbi:MAG: 1,4-dihydroxy-2-naphthoate octaprenyltransferase [Anaerolineae bacterium]|nr:1,4-dihydroxy-2-naphthoate octaprenyltransferase [Anaerolineae bacterium]NUQ02881.1 1,4-dihydroxy-2-naphthoate octaprenyltransferase [Anaerolineae bacterium]